MQNVASLEVCHIKKIKSKACVMKDINNIYQEKFEKLNFSKFMALIITFKIVNSMYSNKTMAYYYLIFIYLRSL